MNEDEAERVRRIFELYLEHGSLMPVVKILNERGWRAKRWVTKKGVEMGGRPFEKGSLFKLLTNLPYLGKVTCLAMSMVSNPSKENLLPFAVSMYAAMRPPFMASNASASIYAQPTIRAVTISSRLTMRIGTSIC